MSNSTDHPPPFQFSLRSLLIFMSGCAVVLGAVRAAGNALPLLWIPACAFAVAIARADRDARQVAIIWSVLGAIGSLATGLSFLVHAHTFYLQANIVYDAAAQGFWMWTSLGPTFAVGFGLILYLDSGKAASLAAAVGASFGWGVTIPLLFVGDPLVGVGWREVTDQHKNFSAMSASVVIAAFLGTCVAIVVLPHGKCRPALRAIALLVIITLLAGMVLQGCTRVRHQTKVKAAPSFQHRGWGWMRDRDAALDPLEKGLLLLHPLLR